MKNKLRISIIASTLCMALVLCVIFEAFPKNINLSAAIKNSTNYAHGAYLNSDGEFRFSYNGATYNNALDRLLAEDGFMYGMDWDWFGTWSNQTGVLGNDNILHVDSPYRPEYVERALYNMNAMGINCLGTWIGPKGCFTFDSKNGYVTGLDEKFIENLRKLLESCRKTNMYIAPALLTHNHGSALGSDVYDGMTESERYNWYFRFYYDKDSRKAFIEKGIEPMCEILTEYQDVIACVPLTIENGSQANDIEAGWEYRTNHGGYTWENFSTLQNEMHDAVKKYMPNVYTSCEDIGGWPDNLSKYNDLKVDIISPQYYTKTGEFNNPETYFTTRPGYIGEFNFSEVSEGMQSSSLQYIDMIMERFYRSAIEQGYLGAFNFGWSFGDNSRYSIFQSPSSDDYESMRNYAIPVSYIISDSKHEYRGTTGKDAPVLLYNNGSETNYWIGGRNVDYFILQRSDNGGKWKTVADKLDPLDYQIDNGLIKYVDKTIKEGVKYCYRVISVYEDGEKVTGNPGNKMTKFVPVECFTDSKGNYAGGFEEGSFKGSKEKAEETGYSDGWYVIFGGPVGEIRKGEDAKSGEHYFYGNVEDGTSVAELYGGQLGYDFKVQPSAMHTISVNAKNSLGMLSIAVQDAETNENLCWLTYATDQEQTGEWKKSTANFMAPSHGKVRIKLMTYDNNETVFYLDDISVQEAR